MSLWLGRIKSFGTNIFFLENVDCWNLIWNNDPRAALLFDSELASSLVDDISNCQ